MLQNAIDKLNDFKKYFHWQILLIVFVNLFLANFFPLIDISFIFMFLVEFLNRDLPEHYIIWFILFIFFITRPFWLPVTYYFLEHKSKNELVQRFIYNLKNKSSFRKKILLFTGMPLLIFLLIVILFVILFDWNTPEVDYANILQTINWLKYIREVLITIIICIIFGLARILFFDLVGSYLILFLFWKIRRKLK